MLQILRARRAQASCARRRRCSWFGRQALAVRGCLRVQCHVSYLDTSAMHDTLCCSADACSNNAGLVQSSFIVCAVSDSIGWILSAVLILMGQAGLIVGAFAVALSRACKT